MKKGKTILTAVIASFTATLVLASVAAVLMTQVNADPSDKFCYTAKIPNPVPGGPPIHGTACSPNNGYGENGCKEAQSTDANAISECTKP